MQHFKQFFESDQSKTSTREFVDLFNQTIGAKRNPLNPRVNYYIDNDSLVIYSMQAYPNDVYISDLTVEPRGIAAIKFLQKVTQMADQYQITLTCISQPLKVPNKVRKDRLTTLYKRFGFNPDKGSKDRLTRIPKKSS